MLVGEHYREVEFFSIHTHNFEFSLQENDQHNSSSSGVVMLVMQTLSRILKVQY
jgi:hypothetical protein